MLKLFLLLNIFKFLLCTPNCEEGVNHCSSCNPITKLCMKCEKDVFIPDKNGGCINAEKCFVGINNCLLCDKDEKLCEKCQVGYYPDQNGGCSSTDNCEVSYRGKCIQCKEDFIYIGKDFGIQICKSLNSEDLKNCQDINIEKGICEKCEEGYFLNLGDKKCIKTENCFESSFGNCQRCSGSYYLNKKEDKCVLQNENFYNCKESIDGEGCDTCYDNYYLSEDRKCTNTKYCAESGKYTCNKCSEGYYLSGNNNICTTEEKCFNGKKDIGVCLECKDGYVIDFKDGKCKSNEEDNELKHCKLADGECKECLKWYYLGEDNKCSSTKNCSESENGLCLSCSDNYYLGKDNKCTEVEHCIYSDDHFKCEECEGKYCYIESKNKCIIGEGDLENCKISIFGSLCLECKDTYYLNESDYLCRPNSDPDYFYKCAKTHSDIDICIECVKGYYLGYKDNKCSKIVGCERSENEDKCLECDDYYCLDSKTGKCEYNRIIEDEDKKFYYQCNKTNEEGTACEICLEGYTLNENGLCADTIHCIEKDEVGNCLKCQNDNYGRYCLKKDFGCIQSYDDYCLECNDFIYFNDCTKCVEGYKMNDFGKCVEI